MEKPEEKNQETSPTMRTYKSDVASFIKKEGKSLAEIAVAEEQKREVKLAEEKKHFENKKNFKKNLKIIAWISFLILIILSTSFWILKTKKASPAKNHEVINFSISVKVKPTENRAETNYGRELFKILELETGSVAGYLLNRAGEIIDLREIFISEKIYPPGELLRAITKNYLLGKTPGDRFLIAQISYYPNVVSGMFSWEKTIKEDLFDFLVLPAEKPAGVGNLFIENRPPSSRFVDKLINNQNARVFQTQTGIEHLSYAFLNQKYLIIGSSPETLQIVLNAFAPR